MIAAAVCIGSREKYECIARPGLARYMEPDSPLAEIETDSIFSGYNEALDAFAELEELEALVLMHEDVMLHDPGFCAKIRARLQDPEIAIVGAIGARKIESLCWWEGEKHGRAQETRGVVDHWDGPVDVDGVDGLLLILSPWAVRNLRFDTSLFHGFHGYDLDICFQARAAGKRVVVEDFSLFHHTKGGFGDTADFARANGIFRRKWELEPRTELPLVSAIVAAYNYEQYLPAALDSALAQDYPQDKLEIIVVDDGSTDATATIAQAYASRHQNIRYVRQDNQGLAAATSRGLGECTGELITLLDADDVWPIDRTRTLATALNEHPGAGLVYGDMEVIDADGNTLERSWIAAENVQPHQGRVLAQLLLGNFVSAPALMFRAEHRDRVNPVPSFSPTQDWYIAARIAEQAEIHHVPDIVARYRRHGANMNNGRRGPEQMAIVLRREIDLRRWMLANLRASDLTVEDLGNAFISFLRHYMYVAQVEGVQVAQVLPVTDEDRKQADASLAKGRKSLADGDFEQAASHFVAALARNPFDHHARNGIDHAGRRLTVPLARAVARPATAREQHDLCIKPGYVHREAPEYFVDLIQERDNVVWQPDVYPRAAQIARALGAKRIIDLGPGSGDKLAALYPEFEIVGIDFGPNLELCRRKYPFGAWRDHDFDSSAPLPLAPQELDQAVVVCADVIEHLVHPELLLDNLRELLNSVEAIVLSTPERDLTRGTDDMGPPEHLCHVREWALGEFGALLEAWDFQHGSVGLTRSNDFQNLDHTILAILFPDDERAARAEPAPEQAAA
jgi:glycosyltransferase involved in cell wall biosynthesis/2-polyprenyl-3-methyl-5-hydroxy-6-metoxy-1,4-benzoquinol methylase